MNTELLYDVHDRPKFGRTLLFALQQLLAIVSATIAVPMIVNGAVGANLSPAAALFGAGAATIVYLLITKFKSPMFFGSSFAFIGSMCAAFAGAACATLGYLGIILGTCLVALLNIVVGLLIKKFGVNWIYRILPPAVIGPIVAIIGLSLAGTAISGIWTAIPDTLNEAGDAVVVAGTSKWVCLGIALVTLFTTMYMSVYSKGLRKLVPFAIGIAIGYVLSAACTGIALLIEHNSGADLSWLKVIDFSVFNKNWADIYNWIPDFTFLKVIKGWDEVAASWNWAYLGTIALAFLPVAVCTMAEHIADHENLSSIIGHNLLEDPGLHRTMIGDGTADAVGAILGGASTTSYGESLATTALTRNASTITILVAALMAMAVSFVGPFNTFLSTIPSCVLNAVCILLYGFIATSGLKMLKGVDLDDNRNIFTISVIFVAGVGGFILDFVLPSGNTLTITTIACALVLGVLTHLFSSFSRKGEEKQMTLEEEVEKLREEVVQKDYFLEKKSAVISDLKYENECLRKEVNSKNSTPLQRQITNFANWLKARYNVEGLTELGKLVGIRFTENKDVTATNISSYFFRRGYESLVNARMIELITFLEYEKNSVGKMNKTALLASLDGFMKNFKDYVA